MRKQKSPRREDPRDLTRINDQIREREVRLIDDSGEHTGIVSITEALQRAAAAGFDLVEVSAKSKPHVCRIMDYGQYRYELAKKQKEAKKKQKLIVVKEIKLRPRIEHHDYDFKMNHAIKFLDHGDKVKFILQFRGRENAHKELGRLVLDRVIADLQDHGSVEQAPRTEGRFMNMVIAPLAAPQKKKIKEEKAKAESDRSLSVQELNEQKTKPVESIPPETKESVAPPVESSSPEIKEPITQPVESTSPEENKPAAEQANEE